MRRLIAAAVLAIALTGCGGFSRFQPRPADLQAKGEWFTLVKPDGTKIECFFYAKEDGHRSWLALVCPDSGPALVNGLVPK